MKDIDIRKNHGVYMIYVNGDFWCTCESMRDVEEELQDIEEEAV